MLYLYKLLGMFEASAANSDCICSTECYLQDNRSKSKLQSTMYAQPRKSLAVSI